MLLIREKTELLYSMYMNLPEFKKEELTNSFKKGIIAAHYQVDHVFVDGCDYDILVEGNQE